MAFHVESTMKMLLLMMMMMTMKTWTGVNSQSTTGTDTCDSGVDSPSVVEALTQLARYQLAASKQLADLTRSLNDIKTNLQHLQKIPKPSAQNASNCTILIQQKVDASDSFYRPWADFKAGFSTVDGNYWIGNEKLHQLTKDGGYKLRIDAQQKHTGDWFWAEYGIFIVGSEVANYLLTVDRFSGNTGDRLSYHSGAMFSTYDRDNDNYINPTYNNSCALLTKGGFWFYNCGSFLPNGAGNFFQWISLPDKNPLLRECRMSLVCL